MKVLPLLKRHPFLALALCYGMVASAAAAPAATDAALNFVGADIESVIKAIGHYTNINFLIDPRVKGSLTLVTEKPISRTQAFNLLSSALRLQGYAVVSGDGYAKVVPEAEGKLQPAPTQAGEPAARGDQVVSQIFHLNFESAANLVAVLRPLISPNNAINANPGNNSVVVTDYADNLKRLAQIIAALDTPASADIEVIAVHHAIASDLAVMINKLLEAGASGAVAEASRSSVTADPRTNALILRAPSPSRAALARALITKLDQPTAAPGNVHVVHLKNADAAKLAQTLRAVTSGESGSANPAASPFGASVSNPNGPSAPVQNGGASNPLLNVSSIQNQPLSGGAGFIQADTATNTLIITAPEAIYRNLLAVIEQLDVRRAQVYIESLIVEITSDKASEFGVQWLGANGDSSSAYRVGAVQSFTTGGSSNSITALAAGKGQALPSNGLSIGIFRQINGQLGLGALAHSLESDGNANILSTPNMITLDNELATIQVGQNVPIITGQFTTTSGANSNPFQTIDRKEVGLTLKVRPQISEGGTIKMAIYHETSSVDASTLTAAAGITLNKRVIENNVIADDGQIIVLGGLIEDSTSDGSDKVKGLGDIPLLGNLFKYNKRERKKTNLMVFLRPVVVRSKEQSTALSSDRYDYLRATQLAIKPEKSILVDDYGQPIIPALQAGQPVDSPLTARPLPLGQPLGAAQSDKPQ